MSWHRRGDTRDIDFDPRREPYNLPAVYERHQSLSLCSQRLLYSNGYNRIQNVFIVNQIKPLYYNMLQFKINVRR